VELSLQLFYCVSTGTFLYVRDKPPIYAPDPYSGWTNRPNFSYQHVTPEFVADIYTNGEGFRVSATHEEYQTGRPDTHYRILLIGPSFAFGWGVNYEDTFAVHLQHFLRSRQFANGKHIEVLNHGVPGLPPANELEWLKQVGITYNPNLVIHFAYGSLQVNPKPTTDITVDEGRLVQSDLSMIELAHAYAKNSAIVFYTGVVIARLYGALELDVKESKTSDLQNVSDAASTVSIEFYQTLKTVVEGKGAELLVVHFPFAYVVHPEDKKRWVLQGIQDLDHQIRFNKALDLELTSVGIKTVNLTERFLLAAKAESTRLYYWLDVHWTAHGNSVAAQVVTDYLIESSPATLTDIAAATKEQLSGANVLTEPK